MNRRHLVILKRNSNFLNLQHEVLLVEGDSGCKFSPRTVAVSQIEEGTRFSLSVLEFTSNVEVRVVMQNGHVVHMKSLKRKENKNTAQQQTVS